MPPWLPGSSPMAPWGAMAPSWGTTALGLYVFRVHTASHDGAHGDTAMFICRPRNVSLADNYLNFVTLYEALECDCNDNGGSMESHPVQNSKPHLCEQHLSIPFKLYRIFHGYSMDRPYSMAASNCHASTVSSSPVSRDHRISV